MSNQVDQQIKLCQQGDVRAQEWLYKRYSSTLLGVSRRYIKDVSLAEDIVHECFIVFFNKIQDLKNTTAIEGWMRRIVVNHSLKYLKGNALHYDIDDVKELDFHEISNEDDIGIKEQLLRLEIDQTEMLKVIDELPDGFKAVFNLYVFEKNNHHQIADKLGISAGTSRSQLQRARKHIQRKMVELLREKSKKEEKVLFVLPLLMTEKLDYIDKIVYKNLEGLSIKPKTSFQFPSASEPFSYGMRICKPIMNFVGKAWVYSTLIVAGAASIVLVAVNRDMPGDDKNQGVICDTLKEQADSVRINREIDAVYSDEIEESNSSGAKKKDTINKEKMVRETVVVRKVLKVKKQVVVHDTIQKVDTLLAK